MAQNNNTILAKSWLQATNDFQQRIPNPTQHGMQATIQALTDPLNLQYWNQFVDTLVNRIGRTIVRNKRWENRLAAFKGERLYYGQTIQEIAPKWIKAHSYTDYDDTLLKLARPEAQAWYHSINRMDRYDISINDVELRRAFTEEYGLNDFINSVMEVPYNSDAWDEYLCMRQLVSFYENEWGFFKVHVDSAPTNEESGKDLLAKIRTYSGKLQFPSTLYNAAIVPDIPVFANPDELILITTPEVEANLDVNTLASVFQLDKADLKYKKVILDEFPIAGAQALLTVPDWFVVHDTLYETTSFYNPQNLSTNYYLHHQEIISCSPFVPAVLFTTEPGTDVKTVVQDVSAGTGSITLTADNDTVAPGGTLQLITKLNGTITKNDDGIEVSPDAATFHIEVKEGSQGELNSRTYVDRDNVLHVQKTGIEDACVLSIVATSTYRNPSGKTDELHSEALEITVQA